MAWHGHGCVLERVERLVRAGLEELEEVLAKEQQEKEGESAVAGGASAAAAAATGAGAGRGMHSHWSRGCTRVKKMASIPFSNHKTNLNQPKPKYTVHTTGYCKYK